MGPVTRFIFGHVKKKGNHFEKKHGKKQIDFKIPKFQTPKYDFSTPKKLPWH